MIRRVSNGGLIKHNWEMIISLVSHLGAVAGSTCLCPTKVCVYGNTHSVLSESEKKGQVADNAELVEDHRL